MADYIVSVIVTVYNKAEYLQDCLESLVNQSIKNIEIIAVDDGSTDDSPAILNKYAKEYPNVRVITQENVGLAGARITGLKHANGEYVGFVDADDFVNPAMYEKLFDLAEKENADLVYCDYECFPKQTATKPRWFREYNGIKDWKFIDKNTSFWSKLIRRDLFEKIDILTLLENYGEYSPIVAMLDAEKITYTHERLYYYRMGHVSMSGGSFVGKVAKYHKDAVVTKGLKNIIIGKPYEKELGEYFDYRYIYTLILLAIVAAKNHDKSEYIFARSELKKVDYKNNQYTYIAVKESYGALKAFVLTQIIPINYYFARVIADIAI